MWSYKYNSQSLRRLYATTFTITDLRGASSIRKTIVRGHFAPLSTIALLAPL